MINSIFENLFEPADGDDLASRIEAIKKEAREVAAKLMEMDKMAPEPDTIYRSDAWWKLSDAGYRLAELMGNLYKLGEIDKDQMDAANSSRKLWGTQAKWVLDNI